jgi:hypothetical protein
MFLSLDCLLGLQVWSFLLFQLLVPLEQQMQSCAAHHPWLASTPHASTTSSTSYEQHAHDLYEVLSVCKPPHCCRWLLWIRYLQSVVLVQFQVLVSITTPSIFDRLASHYRSNFLACVCMCQDMQADAICHNVRFESSSLWWRAASICISRIVPLTFVVGSRIPSRLQPDFRHLAKEHHTSFLRGACWIEAWIASVWAGSLVVSYGLGLSLL